MIVRIISYQLFGAHDSSEYLGAVQHSALGHGATACSNYSAVLYPTVPVLSSKVRAPSRYFTRRRDPITTNKKSQVVCIYEKAQRAGSWVFCWFFDHAPLGLWSANLHKHAHNRPMAMLTKKFQVSKVWTCH